MEPRRIKSFFTSAMRRFCAARLFLDMMRSKFLTRCAANSFATNLTSGFASLTSRFASEASEPSEEDGADRENNEKPRGQVRGDQPVAQPAPRGSTLPLGAAVIRAGRFAPRGARSHARYLSVDLRSFKCGRHATDLCMQALIIMLPAAGHFCRMNDLNSLHGRCAFDSSARCAVSEIVERTKS